MRLFLPFQLSVNKIVLILILTNVAGCTMWIGPKGPYTKHYQNEFANVALPSQDAIERQGISWSFVKPCEDVWRSALRVVHHYEGILRIEANKDCGGRLLVIHGREVQVEVPSFRKNSGLVFGQFFDAWIAVSIVPNGTDNTLVTAAWVSPTTLEVSALPDFSSSKILKKNRSTEPTIRSQSVSNSRIGENFAALTSTLSESGNRLGTQAGDVEELTELWEFIPQVTVNEFFYHLGTQLYGPERWLEKFELSSDESMRPETDLGNIEHNSDYEDIDDQRVERETGRWTSAKLQRTSYIIYSPEMDRLLLDVLTRLKSAAKKPNQNTRVFIIASPEVNAWAMPNGDIFVFSGMLETLNSIHELAAVLAHEFDHVVEHDTIDRLNSDQNVRYVTQGGMFILTLAAPVAGIAAIGGAAAVTAAQSVSTQIVQSVVSNSVQLAGGLVVEAVGNEMIVGHSEEAEIRADSHGLMYINAAGYDVNAELSLLNKLEEVELTAKKKNEPIASGFINCEPGLDKRKQLLEDQISKINHNIKK